MLSIHKVLHPTDFSDSAKPAFELACALARDYRATLVLAHIVPPTHVYAPDGIAVPFPADEDIYDAQAKLARMHPADPEVAVEYHVREGDPIAQILKIATDDAIDVIVMGTHGSSGLTRLLVGSVAESVMRKAPCPVLTVRGQFRLSPDRAPVHADEGTRY